MTAPEANRSHPTMRGSRAFHGGSIAVADDAVDCRITALRARSKPVLEIVPTMAQAALRPLKYLWAAPCSAVGLALAAAVCLAGGSARVVEGVLEVALRARPQPSQLPFQAITFGHVVLGTDHEVLARARAHEQVHVRQYERWGLFFFLAYPASSFYQWCRGRHPYWHNGFEVQAREQSRHL
ncbi:MAG: hypothetical protein ACREU7_04580 [Burkholderiales bacterium]